MPDAILRWCMFKGNYAYSALVRTFSTDGRLWCRAGGRLFLLKDDGTAVGAGAVDAKWEKL